MTPRADHEFHEECPCPECTETNQYMQARADRAVERMHAQLDLTCRTCKRAMRRHPPEANLQEHVFLCLLCGRIEAIDHDSGAHEVIRERR